MNMMATRRRRKTFFSLKPRVLILQRHPLAGIAAAFAVTLLFIVIVVLLSAPPSSPPSRYDVVHAARSSSKTSRDDPPPRCGATTTTGLGEFGEMMVSMLPKNLAFTVFVPSPDSFRRVLKLPPDNDSVAEGEAAAAAAGTGTTYAVVSRVLGFSAVPRRLRSSDVPLRERPVRPLDSVSGLRIYAWRDVDGVLVANGVRSECVDIVRGETVVHVMAGVLMDAEFERSFLPEFED